MALNYIGGQPSSDTTNNNGFTVLDTTNCKSLVTAFAVNRATITELIKVGWVDGTGFTGSNNYLASSNPTGPQKTLQTILTNAAGTTTPDPVIQRPTMMTEFAKYIPASSVGVKNGVAALVGGKVPVAQLPSMGSGYLLGPYGSSTTWNGQATTINSAQGPLKFAEWAIQNNGGMNFQPMVYMIVNASTDNLLGRSVIEVRITNGPAANYSATHPLVATGTGRSAYTGNQSIVVLPCASVNSQNGGYYPATYNTYLTAWLYDAGSGISSIGNASSAIITATAFLMRVLVP